MAAEGIAVSGVTEILKKLSSVVANEITLVWDFNDELKNLQSMWNMILAVMEDAEKKQSSSKLVKLWMEDLKSIAYDAEDVLDEYAYEVILRKCEKDEEYKTTVFNKVRNLFACSKPSFVASWKLAHKVKKINENFNKIAKRKNDLGLQTIDVVGSSSSHELMMKNRETNSFVPEDWKIVGRENDKSTIIKMLLEEEEENSTNNQSDGKHVSVIPIVGMGGLGKTTIAQQVYNDEVVQKHFELKIWICVSDSFDIKNLYKNIANSIGKGKEYGDATTMDDISRLLRDAFRGKKFILVLDDVWSEKPADWNNFKTPFMVGREGSKILVTTRDEKVALIMVDKFKPYQLGILEENDCWSLFKQVAFGSAAGAVETPKLVEIGQEMVHRCKGLPLAVIFLGSLMRSKKKEEEWKIIRDTKVWHESREGKNSEILPSLRLSYDYLPSHLKLCFSYCCLFPKDSAIHRERLIRLWKAEGFLIETPGENTTSMEEIGNEYFHSLVSSFFFQDVKKDDDGEVVSCKMHDLVHDLARSVVGDHECLIVESARDVELISETTRRLNLLVDFYDIEMLPKVLEALKKKAKNLRTVFVNSQHIVDFDNIVNVFKENKRLRVLDLRGSEYLSWSESETTSSSSSIGGLKHLRYLYLPQKIIPRGIGRLRFLQTLSEFNVSDKKEKKKNATGHGGIEELEGLNLLRGDLTINHLQNVTSGTEAYRANLKKKKNLGGLNLTWDYNATKPVKKINYNATKNDKALVVLEGLQPHPNLRTLRIDGFQGSKLPRWMEDSSCLPSLKNLSLYSMDSLKEWVVPAVPPPPPQTSTTTTGGATTTTTTYCFPLLEWITILHCPFLSTITPTTTIFPSLKVLILRNIDERAAKTLVTNNLKSLTSLTLTRIRNLISLPRQGLMENNNTLLSLEISECDGFEGFFPPNMDDDDQIYQRGGGGQQQLQQISQEVSSSSCSSSSSSLQSLKLDDCPALRYYPNIRSLTSLRSLEIQKCKISKSLQEELTCLSSSLEHLEHVLILNNKTATEEEEEV